MRSINFHLKILIAILLAIGLSVTAYQIFFLGIPVSADKAENLWNIDTKIEFQADTDRPVKLQMFIPPESLDYISINESFIANSYGVSVNKGEKNRLATWSARRVKGEQSVYYRLSLTKRTGESKPVEQPGPTSREPQKTNEADAVAAKALIAPIRQQSADVETFISETIKRVNDPNNDNAKFLLGGNPSTENKTRAIDLILSIARIPMERVHTIRLISEAQQEPELWLRSYNGEKWLYFNPETGKQGLPKDRFIWWTGDKPLISLEGGDHAKTTFTLNKSQMNAIRLTKLSDKNSSSDFLSYSLYDLPLSAQTNFQVMLMIPFGVLLILVLRNIIGLQTLGTFTPVLISLAFRETHLVFGLIFFSAITALGLSLRSYLEHLKLQMLPRLSVVLTFVVVLIATISLFSHKLGLEQGLSVSLFPMVILTMTIERLSITWEERGAGYALKVGIGTLFAASMIYLGMRIPPLVYFVFTFPGILLVLVAFMLAMGRYRGYRLTELFRFKAFLKD